MFPVILVVIEYPMNDSEVEWYKSKIRFFSVYVIFEKFSGYGATLAKIPPPPQIIKFYEYGVGKMCRIRIGMMPS